VHFYQLGQLVLAQARVRQDQTVEEQPELLRLADLLAVELERVAQQLLLRAKICELKFQSSLLWISAIFSFCRNVLYSDGYFWSIFGQKKLKKFFANRMFCLSEAG